MFNCYFQVGENRCKKVCTSKSDLRSNDFSIVGSLPRDFELSNYDCYGKPIEVNNGLGKSQAKSNKKPPPAKPVIPTAAKRIDLYARALFPFCFLFFNVIYWSIYLWYIFPISIKKNSFHCDQPHSSMPIYENILHLNAVWLLKKKCGTLILNGSMVLLHLCSENDVYMYSKHITLGINEG